MPPIRLSLEGDLNFPTCIEVAKKLPSYDPRKVVRHKKKQHDQNKSTRREI